MKWLIVAVSLVLVILVVGCTPPVTPSATPAPAPPPTISMTPVPAQTQEEPVWQKVMAAAKKEGGLVVYSFFMYGDTGIKMKRAFKERTGLDVEFITGTGAPQIERIKAERRSHSQIASILDSSVPLLIQAKMEGLTEAAGPLPELQNQEVWNVSPILDKEGHIQSSGASILALWINTKLLSPRDEPKSWQDLLQPRWKGKISIPDPDIAPAVVWVYQLLVNKHKILNDTYFRQLGKQAVLHPNTRMSGEAVVRGEVDMTFPLSPSTMGPFLQAEAPIKTIDMEEGLVGTRTYAGVLLSQSPHPNAARVWLNWWYSKEGQQTFHESYGTESLRKDVPSFLPISARLTPKKLLLSSPDDDLETARIQRERTVKKLFQGS